MSPNREKTEKEFNPELSKYLGIWLDKSRNIEENIKKGDKTFKQYYYIFKSQKLSNGLRILLFKSIILSQIYYGLEIWNFTKEEVKKIETWINSKLRLIMGIWCATTTLILRYETKIQLAEFAILSRKRNFVFKLKDLELNHLSDLLILQTPGPGEWIFDQTLDMKRKSHQFIINRMMGVSHFKEESPPHEYWKMRTYLDIIDRESLKWKPQRYLDFPFKSYILSISFLQLYS